MTMKPGIWKLGKRVLACSLPLVLLLSLAACGSPAAPSGSPAPAATTSPTAAPTAASATEPPATEEPTQPPAAADGKVLVVVFSATGTTKAVAEKIAAIEGADLYEIIPAEPYTEDDLNYYDRSSRSMTEQSDKSVRPEIAGEPLDLTGYTKVYVGYPIWCAEEPRIMDTFAESYDFSGLTVIPFCTSGSSGIGKSGKNLAEKAGTGTWLEGKRFPGGATEADVQKWIESLG